MSNMDLEQLGERLSAYLDGEVSVKEKAAIERILKEDADARRMLDELRTAVAAVSSLPRHDAPASIAEDIQFHVERSELICEADAPPTRARGRRFFGPAIVSMAAVIGLSAAGLWFVRDQESIFENVNAPLATPAGQVASADRLGMGAAAPSREESSPAITGAGPLGDRMAMAATMDQKILAGLPVEAVQDHAFANEPVRLNIPVVDASEREALMRGAIEHLRSKRSVDLSATAPDAPLPAGGFYFSGEQGVNFEGENRRQVLVRASRRDLETLVRRLTRDAPQKRRVSLAAGPVAIRGSHNVRSVFAELDATGADEMQNVTMAAESADGTRSRYASDDASAKQVLEYFEALHANAADRVQAFDSEERLAEADQSRTNAAFRSPAKSEGAALALKDGEAKTKMRLAQKASPTVIDRDDALGRSAGSDMTKEGQGDARGRQHRARKIARGMTTPHEPAVGQRPESFITLVIEIAVDEPKTNPTTRPPRRPRSEKPTKASDHKQRQQQR